MSIAGPAFFSGALLASIVMLIAGSVALSTKDNWWRDELARRGVAHYYLDANNQRQWNWKDEPHIKSPK